jgi:LysM repeat protein
MLSPERMRLGAIALLVLATVAWPAAAEAKECTHTVVAGDTLGKIANRYGVTQAQLQAENPALAKNPDMLRLGQELDVCPEGAEPKKKAGSVKSRSCGRGGKLVEHEVKPGDTLDAIAMREGVAKADIVKRNAALAKNPNALRVGAVLEICTDEDRPVAKSKECDNQTPLFVHEVVPGEHLGQIAGRYGVRKRDLIGLNPKLKDNPHMLSVGTRIRVCPLISPRERSRILYTVSSGDSVGSIALKYDLTRREVERFQQGKLTDLDKLADGQKLVLWVDGDIVRGFAGFDDDTGTLTSGMQLPPGRHYHVKWEAASWGTAKTVRAIQDAVSAYARRMPGGPKIHVGDISKRTGGRFPPHISHQHGRDVDVGYVLKGPEANETKFRQAGARNLDVPRTWALIKSFIDTDEVTYIFMDHRIQKLLYEHARERGMSEDALDELFQYPRGRGRSHGIIRHWRGHSNHFHVRFRK